MEYTPNGVMKHLADLVRWNGGRMTAVNDTVNGWSVEISPLDDEEVFKFVVTEYEEGDDEV